MKSHHTLTAALAAFAGLSFATLYAAPNYKADPQSPVNTTQLVDTTSQSLANFEDSIGVIASYLPGANESLVVPTPAGKSLPVFASFNAAVSSAVAANPGDAQKIISAAVQFQTGNYAGKVKDILKLTISNTPDAAEQAVIGAILSNPAKAADAATGAIQGLILANEVADAVTVVDDTIDTSTHALAEKIGKAAVAATKTAPAGTAALVAGALVDALRADGDKAIVYLDDLARGITAGAKGIPGTTQGEVAAAGLARLNGTALENTKFVAEYVSGALKAVVVVGSGPGTPSTDYTTVLTALKNEASVGASFESTINAVNAAHLALRNVSGGGEAGAFSAALTTDYQNDLEAFMIGAVQNKSSKAADFVTALFADPDRGSPNLATRQAIVSAAVRAKGSGAGKVTAAAITSTALTAKEAVRVGIKSSSWEFAGVVAGAAVKAIPSPATSVDGDSENQADDVAYAAVDEALLNGNGGSINDIALAVLKAKKVDGKQIVKRLVAHPNAGGWREAIVAQAVINDKGHKDDLAAGAQEGAAALTDFEKASLALTADLAFAAKSSSKTAFDDAVADFHGADVTVGAGTVARNQFARAILFSRGGVNIKNAGPLLAVAMKLGTNVSSADLLAISKSIYKKNSTVLDLQYTVIQDALANPDQVFDLVDHQVFTHASKFAVDIASAAVAARPEYAHYVARAAAFRSPSSAAKVGAAAITYAHMKTVNSNDPAAVAAIASATILGIKDAKLPTSPSNKELSVIKAAAASLAKAALLLSSSSSHTIHQSDNLSPTGFTVTVAKGSAGAVTGIVAQIYGYDGSSLTDGSSTNLLVAAITAVAKAAKKDGKEIAQAAAQAAQWVFIKSGLSGEIPAALKTAIANAVAAGAGGTYTNAVNFGVAEALDGRYGAGADGIRNFDHRSGVGAPVTDISPF